MHFGLPVCHTPRLASDGVHAESLELRDDVVAMRRPDKLVVGGRDDKRRWKVSRQGVDGRRRDWRIANLEGNEEVVLYFLLSAPPAAGAQ